MANWYPHVDVGTPTHSPTYRHTQKENGIGAGWGWAAGWSTQRIFPSQEWLQCLNLLLST